MTVSLTGVTIRYGDVTAVDGVDAEFPAGAVGLLGRNGAGKSSILRALLGLVRPVAGVLRILEFEAGVGGAEIRRRVGYMPERDGHITGLNGFETVCLAAELTGLPRRDAARRAHEVLYQAGLEEQRYRLVSSYSAGMRQKVKLATALVHDPELLLLDEPTNGLDPRGRLEMLELIGSLVCDLGKSVVLSSHILQDVESICPNVVLLEKGTVVAAGPVSELTRHATRVFNVEATGDSATLTGCWIAAGAADVTKIGDRRYDVTIPEDFAVARLFSAVLEAGGSMYELVEHRRTLEEVFLGAVSSSKAS